MAEPLFRNEGRAHAAPFGDVAEAGGFAFDHDRAFAGRQPLARKRREQFVLAVAGNAGDAENLAAADFQRHLLQARAVRIVRLQRKLFDHEPGRQRAAARRCFDFADLGADHHARQRRRGFLPRIARRHLFAAAQDRRGVAKPLHLFELVADVEDGAAFGLEPVQHDEELIGFLRRQHRRSARRG